MGRMTDEDADDRRSNRYRYDLPPIDPDDFEAEQDHIEAIRAKSDAEYRRVNGTLATAMVAPWNDNACGLCRGRGVYHLDMGLGPTPCPDCHGTGAESLILDPSPWPTAGWVSASHLGEAAE